MGQEQTLSPGFYIWWLCLNSCLFLAEFHFIQNFAGSRIQKADCEGSLRGRRMLYAGRNIPLLLSGNDCAAQAYRNIAKRLDGQRAPLMRLR